MLKNKLSLNTLFIILAIIAGIEVAGLFCHPSKPPQENDKNTTYQKNDATGPAIFTPIYSNTTRGLECITDWLGTNSDAVVALATIAIALFTWTLWRATTGLLKTANNQAVDNLRSIKASEKSAKAAKESADAFQSIERAMLFVKVERDPPPKQGEPIESIKQGYNRVRIIIINEGKSLAILTKINLHIGVIDDKDIDEKISELKSRTSEYPYGVITISSSSEKPLIFDCKITKSDLQKINESTVYYVCLGHIRYKDVFRKVRQIVFCWKDNGTFFFPDPDPTRNDYT